MTNEEAIKKIVVIRGALKHCDEFMDDMRDVIESDPIDLLNTAMSALNKQIPKKPDLEGDGYYKGELIIDTWICPGCGTRYELECDEYDFCPHCGQHIDFSEVEE